MWVIMNNYEQIMRNEMTEYYIIITRSQFNYGNDYDE